MEIQTKINNLIVSKKIYVYIFLVLLFGIVIMFNSKRPKDNSVYNNKKEDASIKSEEKMNINNTEDKIKLILSKVEGVGDVDIIINYISSPKKIPLLENESDSNEKVVTTNDGPYIITEETPDIEGVIIVAQGGKNEKVAYNIRNAVSVYLGIPAHKVSILNMK